MDTSKSPNANLKANSSVTEDWSGGYKLEVEITAQSKAEDWKLDFELPYTIQDAYGVDLVDNGDGSYSISGQNDQATLQDEQSIQPILIVNDDGEEALMPEFHTDSMMSESAMESDSETGSEDSMMSESSEKSESETGSEDSMMSESPEKSESETESKDSMMSESSEKSESESLSDNYNAGDSEGKSIDGQMTESNLETSPSVTEDWDGGYKLELDITAQSQAEYWKLNFELPYTIQDAYGVDLVDNGDGSYSISGKNDQATLQKGQSIQPIFVIDDGGEEASMPEFDTSNSMSESDSKAEQESDDSTTNSEDLENSDSNSNGDSGNSDATNSPEDVGIDPEAPSQVIVEDPEGDSTKQQGQFAYGEALQKNFLFFEANRSGDLGPYSRIEWRDDATTEDGSTVGQDLEGGYFDAGDHIKFGQPMAASVNMLAWGGVEYREAYEESGQLDELLEAVKWGTDYFLKAHEVNGDGETARLWIQVGEGQYDHKLWTSPSEVEEETPRNAFAVDPGSPGSDVAASTAGALASAAMLFRGVDDAYADKLLKNAEQLFDFAEKHKGKYSDSVDAANPYYTSYSGYDDELASGAAWLYKATGEESYLTKAEDYFLNNVGGLGDWSWAVDDHSYGAAVLLAQESDDPAFKPMVEDWLNKWVNGSENIQYTDGGFAFRAEWGSVPVASSAAFLAQLYNDTVKEDSRYSEFATSQVDYILGDNPRDYSYMIGFGDKYPESPHHRGSSPNLKGSPEAEQENILYGAVVGGPDAADDYAHTDRRDDWITNEVGTSYNAPFASALVQQYDNFGGDPLSQSELDGLMGIDANGVGV